MVHIEMEAEELARVLDQPLNEVTLVDLLVAFKQISSDRDDALFMLMNELVDEVRATNNQLKELNFTLREINRRQLIAERRGGSIGGDYIDTLLYP